MNRAWIAIPMFALFGCSRPDVEARTPADGTVYQEGEQPVVAPGVEAPPQAEKPAPRSPRFRRLAELDAEVHALDMRVQEIRPWLVDLEAARIDRLHEHVRAAWIRATTVSSAAWPAAESDLSDAIRDYRNAVQTYAAE